MMIALLLAAAMAATSAPAKGADPAWLTRAERTNYAETARYEETLEYSRRLDHASDWIRTTRIGVSPEGRDLILVIASKRKLFTPEAALRSGLPVVLIQAGIHAGEIEGKDAGLMLLREMAITRTEEALLDGATVLFLPIYNVDGHERFGPHNRINQKGPVEMGWRTTSRNLNLNRDFMKAEAVETRAWLELFTSWWPDLTVDCHTTDGHDFQYEVTYIYDSGPNVPEPVAVWIDRAMRERVAPAVQRAGHPVGPYLSLADATDPSKGVDDEGVSRPMFSSGYTVLQNRPSLVIEAHSLKDYRARLLSTYQMLRAIMREVNRDPSGLREAVRQSEAIAARPGSVPLRFDKPSTPRQTVIKGVAYRREPSEISGTDRIVYGPEPKDWVVSWPVGPQVTVAVDKPKAYVIPAPFTETIETLARHGLRLLRLPAAATLEVEEYRLTEPSWAATPFEGHHTVTFKTARSAPRSRSYPPGSVLVPMDQPGAAVAVHLLEPQSADSLVAWGFFDAIFERKEYAENYVLEAMAREMLQKDPGLRAEFDKALADPAFAADPRKRLGFFYDRSPYVDERIGLYPIGRLTGELPVEVEPR